MDAKRQYDLGMPSEERSTQPTTHGFNAVIAMQMLTKVALKSGKQQLSPKASCQQKAFFGQSPILSP